MQERKGSSRDRVIAAIYDAALRPASYDDFIDAWSEHLGQALRELADLEAAEEAAGGLSQDPELRSHFDRAVALLEQLGRNREGDSLESHVRQHRAVAFLVAADGRLLECSAAGRAMLSDRCDLDGLCARFGAGGARQLRFLMRALGSGRPTPSLAAVLSPDSGPKHLLARIQAVRPGTGTSGAGSGGRVLLIEALDIPWHEAVERTLGSSFGLSPAEIEVVRQLAAGRTLRDIARTASRSEHTIRNQTKAVLSKTGTSTQADLMRLVAMVSKIGEPVGRTRSLRDLMPARAERVTLRDGRTMEVFRAGAVQGRPVVFLHGMLDGLAVAAHLHDELRRRQLQVICPVRPGFGASDPAGAPARMIERFASDVEQAMDVFGLTRPVVLLGHMSGSVYAYAIAAAAGRRVAGIVCVAGGVPLTRLAQIAMMAPRQQVVAYTARFLPALLPALLRAGIAQIDGADVQRFMNALYRPGSADRDTIERLELGALIQSGYRFSVEQGPTGFLADSHHVVRDWSRFVQAARVPAVHVHGRLDPVVDLSTVQAFCRRHRSARLSVVDDCGQLLFYRRPDAVFEAIEQIDGMRS